FESGLSDAALLESYQTADCLLMLVEDATANNAVMEAMACGLPVVTHAKGGLPEYVTDAEGRMIQNASIEKVGEALERLKDDIAMRREKSQNARRRALSLSWQSTATVTEKLYNELLS